MTHQYRMVQWNRHKRLYDAAAVAGVLFFITAFVVGGKMVASGDRAIGDEILDCAFKGADGSLAWVGWNVYVHGDRDPART